jgi:hypothetical protein
MLFLLIKIVSIIPPLAIAPTGGDGDFTTLPELASMTRRLELSSRGFAVYPG